MAVWPQAHESILSSLVKGGRFSFAGISREINRQLGTAYSRNACIGKAKRLSVERTEPRLTPKPRTQAERSKIGSDKRREKRWARDPSLRERALRLAEKVATRAKMLASNTPKTSPVYRKHLPRQHQMTRGELRAMLTDAVRNTAALEIAA